MPIWRRYAAVADGGPLRDTGGRSDTGGPGDSGDIMCVDDEVPDGCEDALDLGSVDVGAMTVNTGKLPMLSDEDWYTVAFPPLGSGGAGGGSPTVALAGDSTMVFEVRATCGASVACGEGSPREITSYTFVDDQSTGTDPGEGDFSTRDIPWPETLLIRVSRRGGPVNCDDYTLTISR